VFGVKEKREGKITIHYSFHPVSKKSIIILSQKFNNITANSASLKKKVPPSFSYHGIAIDFMSNLGYPLPQRAALGVGRLAILHAC
jgi:hypothetical protein